MEFISKMMNMMKMTHIVLQDYSDFLERTSVRVATSIWRVRSHVFLVFTINGQNAVITSTTISKKNVFTSAHVMMQLSVTGQIMRVSPDVTFAQSCGKSVKVKFVSKVYPTANSWGFHTIPYMEPYICFIKMAT